MYVCVYIYVCVCVCECVCVYIYIYIYIYVYVYEYMYMYVYICIDRYRYMDIYIHIYIYMYIYIWVCVESRGFGSRIRVSGFRSGFWVLPLLLNYFTGIELNVFSGRWRPWRRCSCSTSRLSTFNKRQLLPTPKRPTRCRARICDKVINFCVANSSLRLGNALRPFWQEMHLGI